MANNSIAKKEFEQQVKAYEKIKGVYELFAEVLQAVLLRAVKDLGVSAIVQTRGKGVPNFAEKMIRKRREYPDAVNQFTDMCGARIIVEYQDEIEPVCGFIQRHFELHEAEDLLERLAVTEFGYRSLHFIVSLKQGEFDNILQEKRFKKPLEQLYERRTEEECQGRKLMPGPRFKAEIQVRTLLQHAWAAFYHDRLYKGEFEVPPGWKRDANRIAATLEEADESIARTIRGVESYKTYYGSYMTREERKQELRNLEAVFCHDPNNMRLAHQIARLALSLDDFILSEERLSPFVARWETSVKGGRLARASGVVQDKENRSHDELESAELKLEQLRDPELSLMLADFGWARWKCGKVRGRDYIKWAIALDSKNVDARVALAETYIDAGDPDDALKSYEGAYKTMPFDPRAMGGFIQCKIILERNLDFIPMIRPSLEAGIAKCRERAKVKVYLPQAYYDIGLFALLLGKPYESLTAYCKAVQLSDSESAIDKTLEWVGKLRVIKDKLPELEWVRRFLLTAKVAKLLNLATIARADENRKLNERQREKEELKELQEKPDSEQKSIQEAEAKCANTRTEFEAAREAAKLAREKAEAARTQCLRDMITRDFPTFKGPVVIVAGGCDKRVEDKIREYRSLLENAFENFHGTLFSGGTTAGISGLVGDIPLSGKGHIRKIACLPRSIPAWTKIHNEYGIYYSTGSGFSALETIQIWTDILFSGINPADVKLLGINGGRISAFEFRLAITLGAKVGIIRDSGRSANKIFEDSDWNGVPGLLLLPNDAYTIKGFVQDPPCSKTLTPKDRERMARDSHGDYQQTQKKRHESIDPAMADWDDLLPDLKKSSLQQIDHVEEKLRSAGLAIQRVEVGQIKLTSFSKEETETMAEMEHGRWNAERLLAGWTLGPRDVLKKKSPYLVSWAELAEEVREWDRQTVRLIPRLLKEYGYEVFRK